MNFQYTANFVRMLLIIVRDDFYVCKTGFKSIDNYVSQVTISHWSVQEIKFCRVLFLLSHSVHQRTILRKRKVVPLTVHVWL